MADLLLIQSQAACCGELSGQDAYIGVTVAHKDPDDGSAHELDLYWSDVPAGRQKVQVLKFEPLTLTEPVSCPCGWAGSVKAGKTT